VSTRDGEREGVSKEGRAKGRGGVKGGTNVRKGAKERGSDRQCSGSWSKMDPKEAEPFFRIRIWIICSDPDPEPKGSECKCYRVKLEFSL